MKLAIVGTRKPTFQQIREVFNEVARSKPDTVIVSGGARGIDTYAKWAARLYNRDYEEHLPSKYSDQMPYRAACLRRNTDIIAAADRVFACPGPEWLGNPPRGGTLDSIRKAVRKFGHDADRFIEVCESDGHFAHDWLVED